MRIPQSIGIVSALLMIVLSGSCTKEKTITSTEYVHDIVQSPPDTIFVLDTVFRIDSIQVPIMDTLLLVDTVTVYSIIHDTVISVRNFYDTVFVTDTVVKSQCAPSAVTAVMAMEIQTDPLVLEFVQRELGQSDGWIFYLTPAQMYVNKISANVYDIAAYVDYYAYDFSGDYPLEVGWRMTYISGDPAIASNWQMADPPAGVGGYSPGINLSAKVTPGRLTVPSGRN